MTLGMDDLYWSGEYWRMNSQSHDGDGLFKCENALRLLRRNRIEPTDTLDIGCGGGAFAQELHAKTHAKVLGIDLSSSIIDKATSENQAACVSFRRCEVTDLLSAGDKFQIAFVNDVFEHVPDYLGFLSSIRPVSEYHCFHVPLEMNALSIIRRQYEVSRRTVGHLHFFSPHSALSAIRSSGYEVVDWRINSAVQHRRRTNRSLRNIVASAPRMIALRISPVRGTDLLGGSTLSVLARPVESGNETW